MGCRGTGKHICWMVLCFAVHFPAVYLRAAHWNGHYLCPDHGTPVLWSWSHAPFLYPLCR
jgi:hypothetical protein